MKQAIVRWTFYVAAFFLIGPLAASLLGGLRGPDGSLEATPLVSTTPALGLMLGFAALAIAGIVGLIAAKLTGAAAGLTTAGVITGWIAFRTGTVDELIRTAQSGRPLIWLAMEAAVLGLAVVLISFLLASLGRRTQRAADPAPADRKKLLDKSALTAVPIAIIAGGLGAALIAGSPDRGQALAAAIVGGIAIGAAARLVDARAPIPGMFVAVAVLGILGPLAAYAMAGSSVVLSTYRGTLFPLAWVTPLDWIAGGLLGIPIGMGWAASAGEKKAA